MKDSSSSSRAKTRFVIHPKEEAKARKERIEYFKKLDQEYSLVKENVYVI